MQKSFKEVDADSALGDVRAPFRSLFIVANVVDR